MSHLDDMALLFRADETVESKPLAGHELTWAFGKAGMQVAYLPTGEADKDLFVIFRREGEADWRSGGLLSRYLGQRPVDDPAYDPAKDGYVVQWEPVGTTDLACQTLALLCLLER